jgi:hypothetical protein
MPRRGTLVRLVRHVLISNGIDGVLEIAEWASLASKDSYLENSVVQEGGGLANLLCIA